MKCEVGFVLCYAEKILKTKIIWNCIFVASKVFATLFLIKNTGNLDGRKTAILYFSAENMVDIFLPKAYTFRIIVLASSGWNFATFPL